MNKFSSNFFNLEKNLFSNWNFTALFQLVSLAMQILNGSAGQKQTWTSQYEGGWYSAAAVRGNLGGNGRID